MHPVFQTAFHEVSAELGGFDATSANVHPWGHPHCWSVQQIVEHLVLSMDATRTALEERLEKGRPGRNLHRSRTEWALQLMILSAGHMPKGVGAPRETTRQQTCRRPVCANSPSGWRHRLNCSMRRWTNAGTDSGWNAWDGISCWDRCVSISGAVTMSCICGTI